MSALGQLTLARGTAIPFGDVTMARHLSGRPEAEAARATAAALADVERQPRLMCSIGSGNHFRWHR